MHTQMTWIIIEISGSRSETDTLPFSAIDEVIESIETEVQQYVIPCPSSVDLDRGIVFVRSPGDQRRWISAICSQP